MPDRPRIEPGNTILLLAGLPATGKSSFARWLVQEHGFLHVDVEAPGRLAELGLEAAWRRCFDTGNGTALVRGLRAIAPRVVVDWGFPPGCVPVVRMLGNAGVHLFWLDGDPGAVRESFVRRGTVPISAFETQTARIGQRRAELDDLFGSRRLSVLDRAGRYLPPDAIWAWTQQQMLVSVERSATLPDGAP